MSLQTSMRFRCALHGDVTLCQFNVGSAELEYYGCPGCALVSADSTQGEITMTNDESLREQHEMLIGRDAASAPKVDVDPYDGLWHGHNQGTIPVHESCFLHILGQSGKVWFANATEVDWENLRGAFRVLRIGGTDPRKGKKA